MDPDSGLSGREAAARLAHDGPNALPTGQPPSPLRRFIAEYTSYMQLILVGAAIVSLVIKEWSTAIVLGGDHAVQCAGRAASGRQGRERDERIESMMKATARVRRDGAEAEIPAEQLVTGDVVLIAAGDEVPADGRIVSSSALQIDKSALTGECTLRRRRAATLSDADIGPGEQSNMAFMHTAGDARKRHDDRRSAGSDAEVGKIARMLAATAKEETALSKQMDTLTLWIVRRRGARP